MRILNRSLVFAAILAGASAVRAEPPPPPPGGATTKAAPPPAGEPKAAPASSTTPQEDDLEIAPRGADPSVTRKRRARPRREDDPPEVRAYRSRVAPGSAQPRDLAVEGVRSAPNRDPVEDMLVRSQKGVTLATMLEELLDELAHQLSKEDPGPLAPVAIRFVRLSPNLRQTLAPSIESKLVSRLAKLPRFEQVVCLECRAVRSRVEGGDWVVTMGAVKQADLRRIADDIGAKTFMELDFTLTQVPTELILSAKIYRATDGHILWASAIRGDETTAAVLRTGSVPPSRAEQLAELKKKLEQRPTFGYMALLGFAYLGASGPTGGHFGVDVGIRLFERFGQQRRHTFGFQGEAFLDWSGTPLFGALLSAGYWYSLLKPNLNKGDFRVGGAFGGFIAGIEGNTVAFQLMAEYILVFRLAFSASAIYMVPTRYAVEDLGGFGGAFRLAFNW